MRTINPKDTRLTAPLLSLSWFLWLRIYAFLGQMVLLLIGTLYLKLDLQWLAITTLLVLVPLSTLVIVLLKKPNSNQQRILTNLIIFDTLILTGVLYYSGGPMNPFSIMYLVHVVLASICLGQTWAWRTMILTSICFYLLFLFHQPVSQWHSHSAEHHHSGAHLSLHLKGMLYSYIVVSAVVAYFVSKILNALRLRDQQLQVLSAQQAQLTSITAITADTAHQLNTPLATVAVVVHELQRLLKNKTSITASEIVPDLDLIQAETTRCQHIIEDLCHNSGGLMNEPLENVHISTFLEDIKAQFLNYPVEVIADPSLYCSLSARALRSALSALCDNAIKASGSCTSKPVSIGARQHNADVIFSVEDHAAGIDESIKAHIGLPFIHRYTPDTNKQGSGMGLGIYVAGLIAEQMGGSLRFTSLLPQGTRVELSVPNAVVSSATASPMDSWKQQSNVH